MVKYCKKPVEIEAVRFLKIEDGLPHFDVPFARDVPDWILIALARVSGQMGSAWPHSIGSDPLRPLVIQTLEGMQAASPGDWIIQGIKGELYPCKPDIFAMTYEAVE